MGYNWNQANIVHKSIHTLPTLPVCFILVQEAQEREMDLHHPD